VALSKATHCVNVGNVSFESSPQKEKVCNVCHPPASRIARYIGSINVKQVKSTIIDDMNGQFFGRRDERSFSSLTKRQMI
jgi:hypothetical protein